MPAAVTTPSTQMLLGVQRQLDESFEHLVDRGAGEVLAHRAGGMLKRTVNRYAVTVS